MSFPFTFCALDFETTGSVEGYPVEPWQVGLVVWTPGQDPVCWEQLLRIGPRPFHPRAPGRHAQLRDVLAQSPCLQECVPSLRELGQGLPLVAHNTATEKACLRQAVPMERFGPWIDTLQLARAAWPREPSHRLEDLLVRLGLMDQVERWVPDRGPHDALFDAMGAAVLLHHLLQQPGWQTVDLKVLTHPDTSAFYRHRKEGD